MRSTADRIRQAVAFEAIGLLVATPLGSWVFGYELADVGVLVIVGATAATLWNYLYNLAFDHALRWLRGSPRKTLAWRIVHAVGFELGLLVALLPFFAWWMQISLLEALILDLSFAAFYLAYAFVFTWAYEALFPIAEPALSSR